MVVAKLDPKGKSNILNECLFMRNNRLKFMPAYIMHDTADGRRYLVTRYIPYSVEDWLKRQDNWLQALSALARQMLECIRQLHGIDHIHRDVKPDNFRVDDQGKVFLIDYGLVK